MPARGLILRSDRTPRAAPSLRLFNWSRNMALTPEERREINIKNASHSTGPRSPEGRRRASLNAIKHGLRAEALALPHEDVEELKQMTDDWLDYHQPKSPGERAAVDR